MVSETILVQNGNNLDCNWKHYRKVPRIWCSNKSPRRGPGHISSLILMAKRSWCICLGDLKYSDLHALIRGVTPYYIPPFTHNPLTRIYMRKKAKHTPLPTSTPVVILDLEGMVKKDPFQPINICLLPHTT